MNKIYALTIRQPWAELIISGKKTMELRTWSTDYRGLLWVHAGQKSDPNLERAFGLTNLFKGAYLGVVKLTQIIPLDPIKWETYRSQHLDAGDFPSGYYGWVLETPRRFKVPILGPGNMKLYYPDDEVEDLLTRAYSSLG